MVPWYLMLAAKMNGGQLLRYPQAAIKQGLLNYAPTFAEDDITMQFDINYPWFLGGGEIIPHDYADLECKL